MANKSLCDFDVDGELKATSLDINGAADISGALVVHNQITGTEIEGTSLDMNGSADISGDLVVHGKITQAGVIDREEWGRTYSIAGSSSPQTLLTSGGGTLPDGGGYRVTGHISGTGTDNVAVAVFWNENGTWYVNNTYFGGSTSNHVNFLISGGVPKVSTMSHATTYSVHVTHEHLSLEEGTGTDNLRGYFGTDSYLSYQENGDTLTLNGSLDVNGPADISGNLTGVDAITMNGALSGATSITGTSLDINGNADISGVTLLGTTNLTSQRLQVHGYIDITGVSNTALRWYNGSTFRGGLGLDDWAHSGSSSDITMYVSGDNSFHVSTNNVKRLEIDSSGATIAGNADISGDLTVDGTTYGIYHSLVEDGYYHDNYNGSRNLSIFYKNARADIIRYQAVDNYEYWNGSAWVADASREANVEKLLDGRQDTSWYVPARDYKFRFTTNTTTGWPTQAMIWMQTSWTGSTYPGATVLVEETADATADTVVWVTKVTAEFTSDNGSTNWGLHARADGALHTGNGNVANETRITVDFYGWSPSNSSYDTIPLQNLMITSNFSGTENTDYTNLFSHDTHLRLGDNRKFIAGTGSDLQIYHDGSNSYIVDAGVGDLLNYFSNDWKVIKYGSSETCIAATSDGAVDLYYDNSKKLETVTGGVEITGELQADTLNIDGNADISGTISTLAITSTGHIKAQGGGNIYVYDDDDDTRAHVWLESNATEGVLRVSNGANYGLIARGIANSPRLGAYQNGVLDIYGFGSNDGTDHASDDLLARFDFANERFDVNGEIRGDGLDIDGNADISGNLTGVDTLTATTFSGDLNGTINTATTAATQSAGNNSTKVATTAYADAAVAALVDSAPENLNTLNELAEALNDDDDAIVTINTVLGTKLPLAGGTLTGHTTINTANDSKLTLRTPSTDSSDWNYINFTGRDGTRDSYFGTTNDGTPIWYRDDGGTQLRLENAQVYANKMLKVNGELEATSLDINGNADISGNLTGVGTLTATTLSVTNYNLASGDIPNNAADTTGNAGTVTNGVYTTGDQSISGKKSFAGPTKIEQTWIYDMSAGSLDTTGFACAGLSSGGNGSSATFVFECGGSTGNSYQRIVYNCWNASGTWNTSKNIDEGGNKFDVTASANGSTVTFTFKSRSGTQSYTPRVHVQAMGQSIVTTY